MKKNPVIKKKFANENEMHAFASKFAHAILAGAVIYLSGPLGVGKTTFTRGFLRGLGYTDKVKSPTYTLVEPYEIADKKIFHFDLYRLMDANELELLGVRDYFTQDAICLIEWPEKGFPFLSAADLNCQIAFHGTEREMTIEADSENGIQILQRMGEV
jgi:tRNA threonylcarbamoyladenosine biosynthesis protein TsaE